MQNLEFLFKNRIKNIDFLNKEININIIIFGRIISIRNHGSIYFIDIKDETSIVQLLYHKLDNKDLIINDLILGDIIFAIGTKGKSKNNTTTLITKQIILHVHTFENLQKAHYQSKKNIVSDSFASNMINSNGFFEKIKNRFLIVSFIRNFLNLNNFLEVETPILQTVPSGGENIHVFTTYHKQLGKEMFLRVAPECFLKRLLIGGFEKIFELSKCFRNEGSSIKHMQEFLMLEMYSILTTIDELTQLIEKMLINLWQEYKKETLKFQYFTLLEYVLHFFNLKILDREKIINILKKEENTNELISILEKKHISDNAFSYYVFEDYISKHNKNDVVFITEFPKSVSLFAKTKNDTHDIAFRTVLYMYGIEIAEIYQEENDFNIQYNLFQKEKYIDHDFLNDLKFGYPTTAGAGLGIDRIIMLLLELDNIRSTIPFPNSNVIKNI